MIENYNSYRLTDPFLIFRHGSARLLKDMEKESKSQVLSREVKGEKDEENICST